MNNPFDTNSRGMTARERRIRSKYGLLFAITGVICICLAFKTYRQERFVKTNIVLQDSISRLNVELDSLKGEAFNTFTVNGRYELSLEYLKEVNPKAAKDFEDFFDHQTE